MPNREEKISQPATTPCPNCKGRGLVTEYLREFYHGARACRPAEDYCNTCLMQNHCPVCGGEASWDEEAKRFRVCPACGHDVERVSRLADRTRFEEASGAQRLTSAVAPTGGLILRYLTRDGLFIEFKPIGAWLEYRRSYWERQALTEAAQAMIEAFDEEPYRPLSPWLPEKLFDDMRSTIDDLDRLKRAAAAVARAYQAMPYDHPFGRGLNRSHFDKLEDALRPSAQQATRHTSLTDASADSWTTLHTATFNR